MRNLLLLLSILIFAGAYVPVSAQQYKYRHFTPDDGLPSSTVYRIIQDRKGFIWIATDAGVCRYDGNKFERFTVKDGLPNNEILGLYEDNLGRIWFYTFRKEPAYFYHDSIFRFNPENFFDGTLQTGMAQDKDGTFWFSTSTKGLLKYANGKCTYFNKNHLLPNNYTYIAQSWNGEVWMGMFKQIDIEKPYRNALHLYGKVDGQPPTKWTEFPDSATGNREVIIPFVGTNGQLYGYSTSILANMRGDSTVVLLSKNITRQDLFIMHLIEGQQHNLLAATSKGGFRIPMANPSNYQCFLPQVSVSDMFEDREHNLWMSTLDDGIYFLSQGGQQVQNYYHANESKTPITSIISDSIDKQLYFGTISGAVYHFENNSLVELPNMDNSKYSKLGNCAKDSLGKDWCISTYSIYIFDKGKIPPKATYQAKTYDYIGNGQVGKESTYDKNINGIRLAGMKSIASGKNNEIWVAGFCGVFRIKQDDPQQYVVKQMHNVRSVGICYDKNGKVWFGRVKGLSYIDHDTLAYLDSKQSGITGDITDIKVDANNVLWIATAGAGIYAFRDHVLEHITTSQGLSSDDVVKIHVFGNYLLAATKKGINKIEFNNHSKTTAIFPLQINDGLASKEVNDIYCDGNMVYAATNSGLSVFDENAMRRDTIAPVVYITSIKINERDTFLTNNMTLPYNKNSIMLEFIGLSYKSGKDILYRYRMEGLDTDWIETPFINTQYPALAPGKYAFYVDAKSLQGDWSGHPVSFSFVINPPFWQTWWFRVFSALLFMGIVAAIAYAVFNYYRNRNEVAKKLVQLEGQALRAQMNPHFIFNSLNAIHDFIADSDQRSAHLYLARFAALIRRTLDLSRKPTVNLTEELETLKLYLELEVMRFQGKIDYAIELNITDEPSEILMPAMLLQPYMENAIRHGLMNKEGKGHLKLEITQRDSSLICTITDNGIGRKASAMKGRNLKGHRSHAMDITSERMNAFNEKGQEVRAEVKIIDLEDEQGNALGTQVELTIPLNHN